MDVGVDEPGTDGGAAEVEHVGIGVLDRTDRHDRRPVDQHCVPGHRRGHAVEHGGGPHQGPPRPLGDRGPRHVITMTDTAVAAQPAPAIGHGFDTRGRASRLTYPADLANVDNVRLVPTPLSPQSSR